MRGKLQMCFVSGQKRRITPAHAGKTENLRHLCKGFPDHPRTCGENVLREQSWECPFGSPPHMRGKLVQFHGFNRPMEDHPRTCGENPMKKRIAIVTSGSPPHMRGKLAESINTAFEFRITPAHAGKTHPLRTDSHPTSDHPRTCGENLWK